MKILRLGHAMYVFTSKEGRRYLVDPFFEMNPGCPDEYRSESFMKTIDTVFLTHGHFDHISGLETLKNANEDVMVIAQYELAMVLIQKGYENVMPINIGASIAFDDLKATMVQANHTSSYGETEGTPIYTGTACGYILNFFNDETVYHSGDTGLMSDMKLIQDVYNPSIAILSSSGQFTMGPEEAAYTVKNLLSVKKVIPSHTFPSKETAPSPEILEGLLNAFPVVSAMIGRDVELESLLAEYEDTEVIVMGYGEEKEF